MALIDVRREAAKGSQREAEGRKACIIMQQNFIVSIKE
jgi:hypothetical protein